MSFFDIIAPLYDWVILGKKKTANRIQELAFFSSSDSVADIGGGTGRIAELIAHQVKEMIVIDSSSAMIRQCQKKKGLQCIVGDAHTIPFADEYFDKIIMVDAFHHVRDQRRALQEVKRVLKKQGMFIIEEYNPKKLGGLCVVLLEKILCLGSTFYEPKALCAFLEKEQWTTAVYESKNKKYYIVAKRKR